MTTDLAKVIGNDAVSQRQARDLWPLALIKARGGEPVPEVLVASPATYGQVCDVLRWAGGAKRALIPMGTGTGVCGAVSPDDGDVVLDLTRLDRVLEINEEDLTCRAQAGIVGLRLENALAERKLTLGHFPSSLPVSTLGGLISTRSSGQQSTYHGNIEDMLLGCVVALVDGTLLPLRPGPRSAVGPALHQLFVGAEGALGVVLEAEVRINRGPACVHGRGFAFAALDAGLAAMREVMQRGVKPFVMRLYDPDDTAFQGMGVEGCLLVVAVAGEEAVVNAELAVVDQLVGDARALGEEPWRHWVEHRFDLSVERLRSFLEPAGSYVDTIEIAATWSRLGAVYRAVKEQLSRDALALCHFSHAYPQGCCAYFTFAGSAQSDADAVRAYEAAWLGAMQAAVDNGATVSHHHGIGRLRAHWARQEMREWRLVWDRLRDALDPTGTLNPNAVGGR